MNNTKKIILIILINALMITMGIFYHNYMVDEYKIFIERNKLRVTTLGLEEASVVMHGAGAEAIESGIVTKLQRNFAAARASLSSQS